MYLKYCFFSRITHYCFSFSKPTPLLDTGKSYVYWLIILYRDSPPRIPNSHPSIYPSSIQKALPFTALKCSFFLVRKCLLTPSGSFPYLILYLCSCNCCLLKWNNSLCLAQHPRNFLPWISLLGFRKRLLPNVYQSRLRTHFAWVSKYRNRSDLNCTSERSSVSQRDPGFFFKSKQPFLRAVKHE